MKPLKEILSKHKDQSSLIELLSEIQEEYGYISEEHMKQIEQVLKIPLTEIYGVATFYAAFKLRPAGRHILRICKGTACHVKKADLIEKYIEEMLGAGDKETTADGEYTIECVNCIGACAKAPNIMIDEQVFGELTKEKLENILRERQAKK